MKNTRKLLLETKNIQEYAKGKKIHNVIKDEIVWDGTIYE